MRREKWNWGLGEGGEEALVSSGYKYDRPCIEAHNKEPEVRNLDLKACM